MSATSTGDNRPEKKSKRTHAPITAAEALQLLESAVNYCQQAGLTVCAGNVPNLVLSIDGAMMQGDPPRFVLTDSPANATAPTAEGTPLARPMRSRL